MAQSRLEKIGTIYSRVSGLLRAGALKPEDKPIWYDAYAAFPPKLEPRYDRPVPDVPIRNILYAEDVVRAKYHKTLKQHERIDLTNTKRETQSQQFIRIHTELSRQGAIDQQQVFETALDILAEQRRTSAPSHTEDTIELSNEVADTKVGDSKSANAALASQTTQKEDKSSTTTVINIKNLFQE